jgi:hypothetical protein
MLEQRERRKDFLRKAYGTQFGYAWIILIIWFVFVAGTGSIVGAYTQSWLIALLALVGTSVGGWLLGYRKALAVWPSVIIVILAGVLTIVYTQYVARFNYTHPYPSPYVTSNIFTSRDITAYHYLFLGRQLLFGLICGSAAALVGGLIAFFLKPPYGRRSRLIYSHTYLNAYQNYFSRPRSPARETPYLSIANIISIILGTAAGGACCWALVAVLAATEGWGFGFDIGSNWMFPGLALSSMLGIGCWASIPIWWTGIRTMVTKRK